MTKEDKGKFLNGLSDPLSLFDPVCILEFARRVSFSSSFVSSQAEWNQLSEAGRVLPNRKLIRSYERAQIFIIAL